MKLDAIVVGGSYAGLSAALQLARARRRIAVIDAGRRRNRFAHTSHGFLGQDGRESQTIVDEAKAQLLAYPDVRWISETVPSREPFRMAAVPAPAFVRSWQSLPKSDRQESWLAALHDAAVCRPLAAP